MEQKRVSFGALRCAGSKKGSLSEPCVTQEAKKGLFRGPAQRMEQKRVSFGALRYAGGKKGSLSEPCVTQEAKKGLFRALRYARSKKGSLSEPCVAHGAKKGLFWSPALRMEQKRVSFGALRNAGSKRHCILVEDVN